MQLAITKAKQSGVGWVVAQHSNHYGIAGYYAMMAAEQGLLVFRIFFSSGIYEYSYVFQGLSFTNTSPLVNPTRSKKPALGTNPIALAAYVSHPQLFSNPKSPNAYV
jgi:LDH2 family malate/lactate/ureidoglycolate dehydrogenase